MWIYEKKLQFPVKITKPNPRAAKIIITQYGGLYGINYSFYNHTHKIRGLSTFRGICQKFDSPLII